MSMTDPPSRPGDRPLAVVLLAAGKGTRMRSDLPKVLHAVGAAPLLHHAMRRALSLAPERLALVVGHGGEAVADAARALEPGVRVCVQAEQRGTGDAVLAAAPALEGFAGDVI